MCDEQRCEFCPSGEITVSLTAMEYEALKELLEIVSKHGWMMADTDKYHKLLHKIKE